MCMPTCANSELTPVCDILFILIAQCVGCFPRDQADKLSLASADKM